MCRRTGIRNTGLFEPFRCESCRSYCHVEYLGNGSAYGSFVFCRIAEDHIVGGDASLAVGRVGQIVQPRFACQRMRKFDGIARCVNIRCRSLQVIIYPNAARFADLQSGGLGQCRFRTNPDRQKNHVGGTDYIMIDGFKQLVGRNAANMELLCRGMTFYGSVITSAVIILIGYIIRKKVAK